MGFPLVGKLSAQQTDEGKIARGEIVTCAARHMTYN